MINDFALFETFARGSLAIKKKKNGRKSLQLFSSKVFFFFWVSKKLSESYLMNIRASNLINFYFLFSFCQELFAFLYFFCWRGWQ